MWVDTRNPVCLDGLRRSLAGWDRAVFTEVMPDEDAMWARSKNNTFASELLVEMLI
jgi:hypothetical protein